MSTHRQRQAGLRRAIGAAAVVSLPVAVYLVVLAFVAPATETHWAHADPILAIAPRAVSQWMVPALAVLTGATWLWLGQPGRDDMRRAVRHALLGIAAAAVATGALRLLAGSTMPSFVPAEESAAPGFLLSMTAGYGEELVFRFAVLTAVYFALARRLTRPAAIAVAALITGLAFALVHDAGPGAFDAHYFATRLIIPGMAMSVVFLVASPAFLVAAHCAAHIFIPALFSG